VLERRAVAMVLSKADVSAHGRAVLVGWVSLAAGTPLMLVPDKSAELMGWEDRGRLARLVGAADLIVGVGLLSSRAQRWRWMLARAIVNALIAFICVRALARGTPRRGRTVGIAAARCRLIILDYRLARRLRDAE
jgi:hypothetical protein